MLNGGFPKTIMTLSVVIVYGLTFAIRKVKKLDVSQIIGLILLSNLTMIHSAMRLSMPGFIYGLAFINLPLVTSIKNRFRLLIGNVPETSIEYKRWFQDKEWDGNHLHYFSINSIKKICNESNLKIIDIKPTGNLIFIKKLFPSLFANEISFCVKKI